MASNNPAVNTLRVNGVERSGTWRLGKEARKNQCGELLRSVIDRRPHGDYILADGRPQRLIHCDSTFHRKTGQIFSCLNILHGQAIGVLLLALDDYKRRDGVGTPLFNIGRLTVGSWGLSHDTSSQFNVKGLLPKLLKLEMEPRWN